MSAPLAADAGPGAPSFRLSEMLPGGSFEQGEAPWRLVEMRSPVPV